MLSEVQSVHVGVHVVRWETIYQAASSVSLRLDELLQEPIEKLRKWFVVYQLKRTGYMETLTVKCY